MEENEFEQLFKLDIERLISYYNRIKNQFNELDEVGITAKFLANQSVGPLYNETLSILEYYQNKLGYGKQLLDLAFEWIRANQIRLEYKKYLIRAVYPDDDLNLAVDDCIFSYFREYDAHLREILDPNIQEKDMCALYHIFFSPYGTKKINVQEILEQYENKVLTIFDGDKKISTRFHSLRIGLSKIIENDYQSVLKSRINEQKSKELKISKTLKDVQEDSISFSGPMVERILKSYCISKKEINQRDIENALSQFLTSYFKFGGLYKYDLFKDPLIGCLVDEIFSGLTESVRKLYRKDEVSALISDILNEFRKTNQAQELDGLAWAKDLSPILGNFLRTFIDHLFEPQKLIVSEKAKKEKEITPKFEKAKEVALEKSDEKVDGLDEIFDLSLDVDEYQEKLETMLRNSGVSLIERRNIMRTKVQEFKEKKRKQDLSR